MARTLVYVSGALSDVPEDIRGWYLQFYESIGQLVADIGLVPYVPHLHTDPVRHRDVTPQQVDRIDRTAVTSAMLVIAVADNPSLGVGIEVEMAHHAAKPVVLICRRDRIAERRISRLIRGNPGVVREIVYEVQQDALIQLEEFLRSWLQQRAESVLPMLLK
ncbi:MAG: XRE family transcriptional regulator [Candidatus Kerfeldbacteria bacterium]|nr:XRE family transcriptional regulator [Candidatus Kerfeldbacteria bacterium]